MAHADWAIPSKVSGSGDDTVSVSASLYTGRTARSTIFTFHAVGVEPVLRIVNQAGKPEFATFSNSSAAAEQTGGTLTLSGTSNSSVLTFAKGTDNIGLTVPESYNVSGMDIVNGEAIPGDPGATQEYNWSIPFIIPANTGTEPKTCQIVVTDDAGHTNICTITLAAASATLEVSPNSIDLPWDGSASGTFTVTSNTNWTIE